jgi:tripartite-type tricarboxylate transporter receptor subunit TctC
MRTLAVVMVLAAGLGTLTRAEAQTYPSRPITLMVPPLAGESADVLARTLADPMSKLLGQPVLVKRAGELDSSYRSVPHGAPDGYTLEIGNLDSHRYTMYGRSYDFLRDLMPVALLPSVPAWIVARRELPATDLRELLAWLGTNSDKAWPGRLGFGTPGKASAGIVGAGTTGHICGIYLQDATSTHIQFVPYWGEEAMLQGLVRGQIDLVCGQATNSLAMVRSVRSRSMPSWPRPAGLRCRRFRQPTKWDCGEFTLRIGMDFGFPQARPTTSSPSSMPLPLRQ